MQTWQLPDRLIEFGPMPLIMGIVNATPDSFSDGGKYRPLDHALQLVADGADILDIGGESTRPGAAPVSAADELKRVIPVIEQLTAQVQVPISIDTTKAVVAREAMAAGASIINDISALEADAKMIEVAVDTRAAIVAMHRQGTPQTMQVDPHYDDVVAEVRQYLKLRLLDFTSNGIAQNRIVLDPGIGFGKRTQHNLQLLGHLDQLQCLGRPLCLGVSRKGFINRILVREGHAEVGDFGTVGVMLHAYVHGWMQIARVHQVRGLKDAITLFAVLEEAGKS